MRILVIGAGTMGRGIAGACALAGYETTVFDADPDAQRAVRGHIESSWARAVEKGKVTAEDADKARHRLKIAERLKHAADSDFAIEAVPEALDLKKMVFSELDDLCPPRTIFASNTSSLSITRIAHATGRRDRVVGLHFFNPVAVMPLVEVVRGRETSPETESRALDLVRSLGKEAVRVADAPGFATSRLGVALGLEAMRMVESGVAEAADIDRAMELGYGHRMGPLKTSDLVGLDVRLSIAESLQKELETDRFAPPEILRTLVAEGLTGRKAGEGFYRWQGDKPAGEGKRSAELARRGRDGVSEPARRGRDGVSELANRGRDGVSDLARKK
jgi:3-hydroxybutyryl-CoA dehydrogenase